MSNNSPEVENKGIWSNSRFSEKTCTFTWLFSGCRSLEVCRSKTFTADGDDFKWRLEHRVFRGRVEASATFYLCPDCDADLKKYSPVYGKLKISMGNSSFQSINECNFMLIYDSVNRRRSPELHFGDAENMYDLLKSGQLHVVCDLKYSKTLNISAHVSTESNLSHDLGRIRTIEDFSDMIISVKDKYYPVHKVILAARSSVFNAMFKTSMQESQKNHITITDIEQEIFEEMLQYIYTGKAEKLNVLAFELLPVADKYDLKDLKTKCEEVLADKLSVDNAGEILMLADMHNAEQLKAYTISFIKWNNTSCIDFKNTEIWKDLTTSRPELMRDVLAAFF